MPGFSSLSDWLYRVAGFDPPQVDVNALPAAVLAGMTSLPAGVNNIGKVDPNVATPTVYSVTLTAANTEYSQALPANCRGFEFLTRTAFDTRFAFMTGKVAAPTEPYMTLKSGSSYSSYPIAQGASPGTIYLASATAGVVIEILAWT